MVRSVGLLFLLVIALVIALITQSCETTTATTKNVIDQSAIGSLPETECVDTPFGNLSDISEALSSIVTDTISNNVASDGINKSNETENELIISEIVSSIDKRVDWIVNLCGGITDEGVLFIPSFLEGFQENNGYKEFYFDEALLVRCGAIEFYDKLQGGLTYTLYYDANGYLVFAEVSQYRNSFYAIYFSNVSYQDVCIALVAGERSRCKELYLDELMINAIHICFENAY